MSHPSENLDYRFDDRVAVQYDALRGHPPEISPRIGDVIARLAGRNARILEVGVGTGRIALPTVSAGGEVVGVDLSSEMLRSLAGRELPHLALVRGDITRLPFCNKAFDAAVCVHVLHLVDSRIVLADLMRMVRPGGVIILGRDWVDPASFAGALRNEFRQAVVELAESIDFPTGARGLVQQLCELGGEPIHDGEEQTAVEWETALSPRQVLDGIRSRDDAESWVLPDDLLHRVMARLDAFAAERWNDLDSSTAVTRRFVYSLFRVPEDSSSPAD
ncbi:MAG: class I SAM-dependent methyltransferase [Chromatocurvus sp.]